jgi:hypothetical protein
MNVTLAAVPRYVAGLDLGQASDYSALVVAQPSADAEPFHDVRHIERLPLGTRYPAVVSHVRTIVATLRKPVAVQLRRHADEEPGRVIRPDVSLIVDYTGVGRAVFDMLVDAALDCTLVPVTITGGNKVTRDDYGLHIPKRDLASVEQRLLQEERLRIARELPHAALLTGEMANFQVKLSATGHDSYGAADDWREGNHDDLVLALALAAWWTEHRTVVEIY